MRVVRTVETLRESVAAFKSRHHRIAFVPTMGALHEGHLALVRRARREGESVIASIFVNPAQFAANEDFAHYPRTEAEDLEKLRSAKLDLAYIPSVEDMYPDGFSTQILVSGPAQAGLEDRFRPGHFQGVATIVAKLFWQTGADIAVFGEKDYQQLRVIRQMVKDLDCPIRIIGHETVRETDGLAMSSRNRHLSPEDRQTAPLLYQALRQCASALHQSQDPDGALHQARQTLAENGFILDYLEIRHAETLAPLAFPLKEPARLLAAARLGPVRLIDNIPLA